MTTLGCGTPFTAAPGDVKTVSQWSILIRWIFKQRLIYVQRKGLYSILGSKVVVLILHSLKSQAQVGGLMNAVPKSFHFYVWRFKFVGRNWFKSITKIRRRAECLCHEFATHLLDQRVFKIQRCAMESLWRADIRHCFLHILFEKSFRPFSFLSEKLFWRVHHQYIHGIFARRERLFPKIYFWRS